MSPVTTQGPAVASPVTASSSAQGPPSTLTPTAACFYFIFLTQCPASSRGPLDPAQTGHGTFLQSSGSQSLNSMSPAHTLVLLQKPVSLGL